MATIPNPYFIAGAVLSAAAALLHCGCIFFGASWYRLLGAGEKMVTLAQRGSSYPTRVTLCIATVLLIWSAYGLSGAGVIPRMPLLRPALCAISGIYLARSLAFFPLAKMFPTNSAWFWFCSSVIAGGMGMLYAVGVVQAWTLL
jgi:hypothetical protein